MNLLMLSAVLVACSGGAPSVELVEAHDPPPSYVAILAPRNTQTLTAGFSAPVGQVLVRPGQRVHRGDALVALDTTSLVQQIKMARMEELAARAMEARANDAMAGNRRSLALEKRLRLVGYGTETSVHEKEAQLRQVTTDLGVQVRVADARAAVRASLQAKLEHATITAPFDGMVGAVQVKPGDSVSEGATVLRMVDPDDLVLRFVIPVADEILITVGQHVELALPHKPAIAATVTQVRDEIDPPASFRVVDADLRDAAVRGSLKISSVGRVTIAAN